MHKTFLSTVLTIAALFLLFSCSGDTESTKSESSSSSSSSSASSTSSGGVAATQCEKNSLYGTKLRRMTRDEYRWTLNDLFNIEIDEEIDALWPEEAKVHGFRNSVDGLVVGDEQIRAFYELAERASAALASQENWFEAFAGCNDFSENCSNTFFEQLGLITLRRPLDDATRASLTKLFQTAENEGLPFSKAAQLIFQSLLQHPSFLYRLEFPLDGSTSDNITEFDLAARLAFFLWSAAPDPALLDLAAQGKLRQNLDAEIKRMLDDSRALRGSQDFYAQWLQLSEVTGQLSTKRTLANAMVDETLKFVATLSWDEPQAISNLFSKVNKPLSPQMAEHYGVATNASEVPGRPGLLGLAAVAVTSGGGEEPSLVQRALYIYRNFLCRDVPDPPEGVESVLDPVGPGLSERQSSQQRLDASACAQCHAAFDPLGYALDALDGEGRIRNVDRFDNPVFDHGEITLDGEVWSFNSLSDLAKTLSESEQFKQCFAEKIIQHTISRHVESEQDLCHAKQIAEQVEDGHYTDYLRAVMKSDWFGLKQGAEVTP